MFNSRPGAMTPGFCLLFFMNFQEKEIDFFCNSVSI